MRKSLNLMIAALAVALAAPASLSAMAQTAPASKGGVTIDLSAAQQQKKYVAPTRAAPARAVQRSAPARNVQRSTPSHNVQRVTPSRNVQRTTPTHNVQRVTPSRNVQRSTPSHNVQRVTPSHNVQRSVTPTHNFGRTNTPTRNIGRINTPTRSVQQPTNRTIGRTLGQGPSLRTGRTLGQGPGLRTGRTLGQGPGLRTGRTLGQGPGLRTGRTLGQGPGLRTGRTGLNRGPGNRGITVNRNQGLLTGRNNRGNFRGWTGGPRRFAINRDRRRIFVNNGWRTFVPLIALGTFIYGAETYYADGYVSMPEPVCDGFTEDGTRLRWMAVPTEDGGSEFQCVAYSTQRNRAVSEIVIPDEPPVAEAPVPVPVTPAETTGVGPSNTPLAAVPAPGPAPATGCELLIYSEANFKGLSAPADADQPGLGESGWQNEIASLEIKSGTWDFYSDEEYGGEMMRLGAGTYPTLDPKWSKHIGSFMCSAPGK